MANALATNSREQHRVLIQRILVSKQFSSSPRLYELLNYIGDAYLRDSPQDATEQQIGIHVFGRKAGYNCAEDSIVRSEIRQLRFKLSAYFSSEGVSDDTIIEIPKGKYLLAFRPRLADQPVPQAVSAESTIGPAALDPGQMSLGAHSAVPRRKRLVSSLVLTGGIVVVGMICAVLLALARTSKPANSREILLQPFLSGGEPVVVFSNAALRGTSTGAIQTLDPSDPSAMPDRTSSAVLVDESYTGVGEVAAVHALDGPFVSHGKEFLLRRSLLLSWEEVRENNVIVLGSTSQNSAMQKLPTTKDFRFASLEGPAGRGGWGILNIHPSPNERPFYTTEHPDREDFAIIALLRGPTDSHWMLLLGGAGTYGTQAAAEFATSEKGAKRILELLGSSASPQPFEAVLRVDLVGKVPLNPEIVAFRKY